MKNVRSLAFIGLATAIICILGPLSIPIGIVPLSLTNLAILLVVVVLGWKLGTLSCLLYLFIGMVGLPVFSGFEGGIGKLLGPTGGYLIGFLFMAIISGLIIDRFRGKYYVYVGGMVLGTTVLYVFGTLWLSFYLHISFISALFIGVIPFVLGDFFKIICATLAGSFIRKQLMRAKLLGN